MLLSQEQQRRQALQQQSSLIMKEAVLCAWFRGQLQVQALRQKVRKSAEEELCSMIRGSKVRKAA